MNTGSRTMHGQPRDFLPGNALLFAALAALTVAVSVFTNRAILTDEVLRGLLGSPSPSAMEQAIAGIRRWESIGYLGIPLLLLLRTVLAALLVQLVLLLGNRRAPFGLVLRGALLGHLALWAGTVVQALWLASLPAGAIRPEVLGSAPGSIGSLLPELAAGPELQLLLDQVTVFDLGWIVLFALAIEDGRRIHARPALAAVTSVWMSATLARWGLFVLAGRIL